METLGDRSYQVLVVLQLTQSFDFPDPIRQSFLPHFSSILHNFLSILFRLLSSLFFQRTKPPISLGQGPFQRIHHPRMSTTTSKASAPTLEKKPVKFSNLLLGAGLNLFEVWGRSSHHWWRRDVEAPAIARDFLVMSFQPQVYKWKSCLAGGDAQLRLEEALK